MIIIGLICNGISKKERAVGIYMLHDQVASGRKDVKTEVVRKIWL